MQFKVFKLAAVIGFALMPHGAMAIGINSGGIPVHCQNCQEATQSAAVSINEQIKAQTKAIEFMLDYHLRAQQLAGGDREAAVANMDAAMREERAFGANSLPNDACSVYAGTGARSQAKASQKPIREDLAKSSKEHTRQSRHLPTGEPRNRYSATQVIEELDPKDPASSFLAGQVMFENTPIDPANAEELAKAKRLQNLLAVPFPVSTPSEKEVERIREGGTTTEIEQLAASIALQRRQEMATYILDTFFEERVQRIDAAGMDELVGKRTGKTFKPGDKLSPGELQELLSTYRVNNPDWYESLAEAEDAIVLQRDQSMMMAEILNSLWDMRQLMAMQLRLAALDSARETSQAGLMPR